MKSYIKITILALLICASITPTNNIAKIMRTRAGLKLSLYFTKIKNGSSFTLQQMAQDAIDQTQPIIKKDGITLQYDKSGTLTGINDGKQAPLFLGSIPYQQSHIDQLKSICNCQSNKHQKIGLFTLNEPWEVETAGLSKLIKTNKNIDQFYYATPDFTAPTLIHLIRIVHDLEKRDHLNQKLSLVHCKAGRGRSATAIGAYLIYLIHKAGKTTTVQEIEKYLISHRPIVHLSSEQKNALSHFYKELKNAKTFENLYKKYEQKMYLV